LSSTQKPPVWRALIPFAPVFLLGVISAACGGGGGGTVAAVAEPPAISLSATSLNFDSEPVGTSSSTQAVTLRNTGNSTLSITDLALSGTNAAAFSQANTCGISVAPGGNCTISISFAPSTTGVQTASVIITDNAAGSPHTVALKGTGTAPTANLSATTLSFGNQSLRTTSPAQTMTVTNTGDGALNITALALHGANAGDFAETNTCGSSVAAGASCAVSITFTPSASGNRVASLTIDDNAAGSPQTVNLTGAGTVPSVSLSATSLSFPIQTVGTASAAQVITLANTGGGALSITSLSIAGANSTDFAQTNTCGGSLAPQANCTISITYKPTAARSSTASVSVIDNAPTSPQTISLSGNSTANQVINVSPGNNLQSLVNQNPAGTTFSLGAGTYRLQSAVPKDYDTFVGDAGAVLNGASLLTVFNQSGSYWIVQVQVTQLTSYNGVCDSTHPACTFPEDLFFDGNPKVRVASLASVGPGTWYLDYTAGLAYLGDDPTGHTVEISTVSHAFSGSATSVVIQGLTVEKYACQAQEGAIHAVNGTSWTVDTSEVRNNHGTGIRVGNGMTITNCNVHNNGQLGIGGGGSNICIQSCEISNNNTAGYAFGWEAGGVKLAQAYYALIQYCNSHDNKGPGFMTDCGSQYITYDSNTASNNQEAGIYHEISYDVVIKNNTITNEGVNPQGTGPWYGAGIDVYDSANVQVYGNKVINCANGIVGRQDDRGTGSNGQPYQLMNLSVHDNTITQSSGYAEGIVANSAYTSLVYSSWNNHFQNDTFNLTNSATYNYFFWLNQPWTLAQWETYSNLH